MESTGIAPNGGFASSLGDLVLRVHGGPDDGDIVRLDERKSTIGSGAECTYRICDEQIQSVQCLILRGNGGTLVRRWGEGTLLNGQQFLDSHLRIGDRLMMGPVEMEVIEDNVAPTSSAETPYQWEEPLPAEVDVPQTESPQFMEEAWQEMCNSLRREIACLQEERQTWLDQRRRWESEMAGYQDVLSDLTRQFDEFQQVRRQERDAWLEEFQQLKDSAALVKATPSEWNEPPVDDAIILNEETRESLAATEAASIEWNEAPVDDAVLMNQASIEPSDQVDGGLPQDEEAGVGIDSFIYDRMEETESEEESGREKEPHQLDDHDTPLLQPEFAAGTCGVDDGTPDESMDDESVPEASYIAEEHEQIDAPETEEDSATPQSASWLEQYGEQQDESDSSIADYMNRLLQRVGGNGESPSLSEQRDVEVPTSSSEDASSSEIVAQSPEPQTEHVEADAMPQPEPLPAPIAKRKEEYAPRNTAPERDTNLAAMRELANVSARNAIQTCDKNRTAKGAMSRIPLLLVELACGGLLLYWAIQENQAVAYAGAAVCFITAAMTGARTLWLFSKTALSAMTMPRFGENADPSHTDGAS